MQDPVVACIGLRLQCEWSVVCRNLKCLGTYWWLIRPILVARNDWCLHVGTGLIFPVSHVAEHNQSPRLLLFFLSLLRPTNTGYPSPAFHRPQYLVFVLLVAAMARIAVALLLATALLKTSLAANQSINICVSNIIPSIRRYHTS
jgi:hypothetical protein